MNFSKYTILFSPLLTQKMSDLLLIQMRSAFSFSTLKGKFWPFNTYFKFKNNIIVFIGVTRIVLSSELSLFTLFIGYNGIFYIIPSESFPDSYHSLISNLLSFLA